MTVREDLRITEKAPTKAFSWLKAPDGVLNVRALVDNQEKVQKGHSP